MSKSVVILHSGGLDSTVCMLEALAKGHSVLSLGIDYGQTHKIEHLYADAQCLKHNVERKVIEVTWDRDERINPTGRTPDEMRSSVSPAFLQGRNIVFFSIACAEASGIGADEVWTGINAVDFSGYPDCTPEFYDAYVKMAAVGNPGGSVLKAPLLHLSKVEIARKAKQLGIKKGDTWSCYRPKIAVEGVRPCGDCDACTLHNYAWDNIDEK